MTADPGQGRAIPATPAALGGFAEVPDGKAGVREAQACRDPKPTAGHSPMLLTVKDLEVELQLGRTRTYELVRSGEIPVLRIGRTVRIPREALNRWIEAKAADCTP